MAFLLPDKRARELHFRNEELKLRWVLLAKQFVTNARIFFKMKKGSEKCIN